MQQNIEEVLKEIYENDPKPSEELNRKIVQKIEEREKIEGVQGKYEKAGLFDGEQTGRGQAKRFPVRVAFAGAAVFLLAAALILPRTSLAEQIGKFFGSWTRDKEVGTYVEKNVFEDEDKHIRVSVEEVLSDGWFIRAALKYEAKDKAGKKWLKEKGPASYKWLQGKGAKEHECYDLLPESHAGIWWMKENYDGKQNLTKAEEAEFLPECSTDAVQYFALTFMNYREISVEKGLICYPLPSSDDYKLAFIDVHANVPVYEYMLNAKGGKKLSKGFEPKKLRISKLSFILYGKDGGVFFDRNGNDKEWPSDYEKYSVAKAEFIHENGAKEKMNVPMQLRDDYDRKAAEKEYDMEIRDEFYGNDYDGEGDVMELKKKNKLYPFTVIYRIDPEKLSEIVLETYKGKKVSYMLSK